MIQNSNYLAASHWMDTLKVYLSQLIYLQYVLYAQYPPTTTRPLTSPPQKKTTTAYKKAKHI